MTERLKLSFPLGEAVEKMESILQQAEMSKATAIMIDVEILKELSEAGQTLIDLGIILGKIILYTP